MTDEEKAAELLPITAQQIYVLLRLGEGEGAAELSKELSITE